MNTNSSILFPIFEILFCYYIYIYYMDFKAIDLIYILWGSRYEGQQKYRHGTDQEIQHNLREVTDWQEYLHLKT